MAKGRILAGAIALAAAGLALAPAAGAVTLDATVVSVVDGDTIKVRARGALTTVRMIGIDTPETRHPSKPVQCFGPAATKAAKRLLPPGRAVRLVTDSTQDTRDRYGRLLAYVYPRGKDGARGSVNYALVASGSAKVYVYGGVPFQARRRLQRRPGEGAHRRRRPLGRHLPRQHDQARPEDARGRRRRRGPAGLRARATATRTTPAPASRSARRTSTARTSRPRSASSAATRTGSTATTTAGPARPSSGSGLSSGPMALRRMDNVLIVVEDLEAATAFFAELGLEREGEQTVEGPLVDRLVGLEGVRADIAMMRMPDGHGRVELTRFHAPPAVGLGTERPANALGMGRIMFAVDDIDEVVARLRGHGGELVGEIVRYGDVYRLAYLRGPEGIVIGLAESLATGS